MSKNGFLLLLLALAVGFSSCRTKRTIIKAPIKEFGEQYLLEKMEMAETRFDYLSARCNISLTTDRKSKMDFKGQLRIKKDSIIWISLSPAFGIEVARMIVTPDSVKFINRLDKTYFDDDFSFINTYFSSTIDFDVFQALITGNDLSWYDDDNFHASIDAMDYRLSASKRTKRKRYLKKEDTPNFLVQNIWLSPETFKILRINLKEFGDETKKLQAEYDLFQTINGQLFPTSMNFELGGAVKTKLFIECSRLEVDQSLSFPFRIPDNFTKIK